MKRDAAINNLGLAWLLALSLGGCETQPDKPVVETSLPVTESPFDILVEDLDRDGQRDISVIAHGEGYGQTFYQLKNRQFKPGAKQTVVGFHPGNLLAVPGDSPVMVLSAEGVHQIVGLRPDEDGNWQKLSAVREEFPGRSVFFDWPDWGQSLAVAPFKDGYISLHKGYNPLMGAVDARYQVNLSEEPERTVRRAEKIQLGDLDGDDVVELLMASPITRQVFVVRRPKEMGGVPKAEILLEDPAWGSPNSVLTWDMNGDGINDLLIPEQVDQGRILIYHAQAGGGYAMGAPIVGEVGKGVRQLAVARDKDGKALMLSATEGGVILYDITANPELREGKSFYPNILLRTRIPEVSPKIELTDVDNDGYLDAVVGRVSASAQTGNVWIAFGPLWERFTELDTDKFVLQ